MDELVLVGDLFDFLFSSVENAFAQADGYFPKGTNLARHSAEELAAVAAALNGRPRKTLAWRTPAEVLTEHLAAPRHPPSRPWRGRAHLHRTAHDREISTIAFSRGAVAHVFAAPVIEPDW